MAQVKTLEVRGRSCKPGHRFIAGYVSHNTREKKAMLQAWKSKPQGRIMTPAELESFRDLRAH